MPQCLGRPGLGQGSYLIQVIGLYEVGRVKDNEACKDEGSNEGVNGFADIAQREEDLDEAPCYERKQACGSPID